MHACMAIWNISSSIFSRTHHSYPFHNSYPPYSHENISPFSHHLHIYIPITHIICSTASRFISLMPHAPPLTTISCIPISHWPFPSHHLSLTSSFHITHPMHAPIAIKPIVSYPFSFPSPFLSLARSISPNRMEFGLLTMHHYYYYCYWTWAWWTWAWACGLSFFLMMDVGLWWRWNPKPF